MRASLQGETKVRPPSSSITPCLRKKILDKRNAAFGENKLDTRDAAFGEHTLGAHDVAFGETIDTRDAIFDNTTLGARDEPFGETTLETCDAAFGEKILETRDAAFGENGLRLYAAACGEKSLVHDTSRGENGLQKEMLASATSPLPPTRSCAIELSHTLWVLSSFAGKVLPPTASDSLLRKS